LAERHLGTLKESPAETGLKSGTKRPRLAPISLHICAREDTLFPENNAARSWTRLAGQMDRLAAIKKKRANKAASVGGLRHCGSDPNRFLSFVSIRSGYLPPIFRLALIAFAPVGLAGALRHACTRRLFAKTMRACDMADFASGNHEPSVQY
jgi:hypothetical protein